MKLMVFKPVSSIIFIIVLGIVCIIPWLLLFFGWGEITGILARLFLIGYAILGLTFYCSALLKSLHEHMIINEKGVAYIAFRKHHFMTWEEIKVVGIGKMARPGGPKWLYISAASIPLPILDARMENEKFFMVHYRKKVEKAIRIYWNGPISGIDFISDYP